MAEKNLLLVEGNNDLHFFLSLIGKHFSSKPIKPPTRGNLSASLEIDNTSLTILDKNGFQNLLGSLNEELDGSDLERLGIVVDADRSATGRWREIAKFLTGFGYQNVPTALATSGSIITEPGKPKVGVWIMPDNLSAGYIENFVISMLQEKDALLWKKVKTAVDRLPLTERRFAPKDKDKAYVYTWLAWQKEPGMPLGRSITAGYFDANASDAQQLIEWLRQLYLS